MNHPVTCHEHNYVILDKKISSNEKKTIFVVILTFITMIVEIFYGYITGSMALLADGWHMGSHVGALAISIIVYRFARSKKINSMFAFGSGKLIPLGGYTSALMLGLVAIFMAVESIERFISPQEINFKTAMMVAVIGLVVNLLSAYLLWDHHEEDDHDHGHTHVHDHNHQSALVHVIADALTSVLALIALFLGQFYGLNWADPLIGIIGAAVILKWAYGLCKVTAWELLDGTSDLIKEEDIKKLFADDAQIKITNFHYWRIAPSAHACEMTIISKELKGADYYHKIIQNKFSIEHLMIEEKY